MDIPRDLVYGVIDDYKKSLDSRLVGTLMERETHVKVFGASQSCLFLKDLIDTAIKKYLDDRGLGEEE